MREALSHGSSGSRHIPGLPFHFQVDRWPDLLFTALVGGFVYALTVLFVSRNDSNPALRAFRLDVLQLLGRKLKLVPEPNQAPRSKSFRSAGWRAPS